VVTLGIGRFKGPRARPAQAAGRFAAARTGRASPRGVRASPGMGAIERTRGSPRSQASSDHGNSRAEAPLTFERLHCNIKLYPCSYGWRRLFRLHSRFIRALIGSRWTEEGKPCFAPPGYYCSFSRSTAPLCLLRGGRRDMAPLARTAFSLRPMWTAQRGRTPASRQRRAIIGRIAACPARFTPPMSAQSKRSHRAGPSFYRRMRQRRSARFSLETRHSGFLNGSDRALQDRLL
jgi:hypothetical protein